MNRSKHVDTIVAIVSLLLIASGGILYFSQSGLQFLSEIIIIIGFILLGFSALGGKGGERKEARNVTPGPQPPVVGGGGKRTWGNTLTRSLSCLNTMGVVPVGYALAFFVFFYVFL